MAGGLWGRLTVPERGVFAVLEVLRMVDAEQDQRKEL